VRCRRCTGFVVPAALALLASCGGQVEELPPRGQILLFVDTDAPVPPAPGTQAKPDAPPWLFDRLRIEVLLDDVAQPFIPLAERDFSLHEARFADGPVSVGVFPNPGEPNLVARIRLFRGDRTRNGEPIASAVVESRVRLPPTEPEGIRRVFVKLEVGDVGRPRGVPVPLDPELSIPRVSEVGSWAGARVTPCPAPAGVGEACVPGGAFWMGDPLLRDAPGLASSDEERLVVVSPFYLDLTEVTVGELREQAPELAKEFPVPAPSWSGASNGDPMDDFYTYTAGASAADPDDQHASLPVNAVTWAVADAYCRRLGKQLPSEAMFEFVASGRGVERSYVWGDDDPSCGDAVYARSGKGLLVNAAADCRPPGTIGGPLSPGSASRDRIDLDDGAGAARRVVDLAGNLREWVLDWHAEQSQGSWSTPGLLSDPVADAPSDGSDLRSVRGGSWIHGIVELRAAAKRGRPAGEVSPALGFRCARR
jgi:formylglycine-generating enzyme